MAVRSSPQSVIALALFSCIPTCLVSQELAFAQEKGAVTKQLDSRASKALRGFGVTFAKGTWQVIDPLNRYELPKEKANVLGEDGARLVEKYRKGLRDNRFGTDLFTGVFDTAIWSGGAAAIATGGAAAPVAIVGAAVATVANIKATEALKENLTASTARMFVSGLDAMNKRDKAEFNKLLQGNDYSKAVELFNSRTSKLTAIAKEVKSITKEFGQGQEVEEMTKDLLSQVLVGATEASLRAAAKNHQRVQDVKKELAEQVAFFKKFSKDTEDGLSELAKDIKNLDGDIGELKTGIKSLLETGDATAYQVAMIQEVMFDQQPAGVKVQMLKGNMLPGLTTNQRDALTKLYTAEAKKAEILSSVSKVVNTARDVATILGNLGMENKGVAQVVQYASVAQTALVHAFSTPPNPIGAIAAVTGLFGSGSEDSGQQQFAHINKQLEGIRKQLDTVIELQRQTLKSIEELSNQIADMEKGLHDKLDAIWMEQKQISKSVKALLWSPYTECSAAWDSRDGYFDDGQLRFDSGPKIYSFTKSYSSNVLKCASSLNKFYAELRNDSIHDNPLDLGRGITLSPKDTPPKDEHALLKGDLERFKTYHDLAITFALDQWSSEKLGGASNLFVLYSQPSRTVVELYEKTQRLKTPGQGSWEREPCLQNSLLTIRMKRFLCAESIQYIAQRDSKNHLQAEKRAVKFLKEPILRDQVKSFVEWTALASHPYDFAPGGAAEREPMTMSALLRETSQTPIQRGRKLMEGALFVLDLSIAQQAMLYGDLTAEFLLKSLWDSQKKRIKSKAELADDDLSGQNAWQLLENPNNPWLRQAVAMLILDSRFLKCKRRSLGVDSCKGRQALYQMVMKQFMPIVKRDQQNEEGTSITQLDGAPFVEIDPSANQVRSGSEWMRKLFDLAEDVTFEVKTTPGAKRTVVMNMAGAKLPIPDVSSWVAGRLHYPEGLQNRLHERDLMIDNYLDYTLLDEIPESGERLVRVLVTPDRSKPTQNPSN